MWLLGGQLILAQAFLQLTGGTYPHLNYYPPLIGGPTTYFVRIHLGTLPTPPSLLGDLLILTNTSVWLIGGPKYELFQS